MVTELDRLGNLIKSHQQFKDATKAIKEGRFKEIDERIKRIKEITTPKPK